ncbi:MAG: hypothetical protein A2X23_01870 [Chloroflexi bacterium GWC2_73_18]|nr:MAG: hypothetical protein A2X23_01870 [Chloroflexi bacterium GWC2_73_18]
MRFLVALSAISLATAAPATAVQPDREPAVAEPLVDYTCGFEVDVTFPTQNAYVTVFFDRSGNLTQLIVTGQFFVTLTNPANGVSIDINASGPARIDFAKGTLYSPGAQLLFAVDPLPGSGETGIFLIHGRLAPLSGTWVGEATPLCPTLAVA